MGEKRAPRGEPASTAPTRAERTRCQKVAGWAEVATEGTDSAAATEARADSAAEAEVRAAARAEAAAAEAAGWEAAARASTRRPRTDATRRLI